MDAKIRRTSLLLPIVISTAIALAFYLLVVWDPIGIYGHVRQYLEYRIHPLLEWMAILLGVSWLSSAALAISLPRCFFCLLSF